MKVINRYLDEISKREFKTEKEAIASEIKNGGIKKLFSFWKEEPKDEGCSFSNGSWAYQRKESEYILLKESLLEAIKQYEPWISKLYDKCGGISKEHLGSGFMIERYLSDGNSELYEWYCLLSEICPVCFRQFGQPYYANNCNHSMKCKGF